MTTDPRANTNAQRRADKERKRRERCPQNGPLMQLGTWMYRHGGSITSAPEELLRAAERQLAYRLKAAQAQTANARARKKIRWLTCWQQRLQEEFWQRAWICAAILTTIKEAARLPITRARIRTGVIATAMAARLYDSRSIAETFITESLIGWHIETLISQGDVCSWWLL